jgi:hypothetical protein
MTPVAMVDRVAIPALASPGELGPNGGSGQDQAGLVLASGPAPTNGFVVAQASPAGEAQPISTVDRPAVVVESANRSNGNGQGSGMGERVLKYMNALHDNGRRVAERVTARAPAVAEPAVKLVVATEPGPAAAALAPAEQQGSRLATNDTFEANLQALQQLYDYNNTVHLAANVVSTATGMIKQLTERMG